MALSTKPLATARLDRFLARATGSEIDAQARFAQLLDKNQRWGIKSLVNSTDWMPSGTNNTINYYGELDRLAIYEQTIAQELNLTGQET